MPLLNRLLGYFASLTVGRIVLWCYLLWYLNTVAHHFDPTPSLWFNSLGISAFIGVALVLSVGGFHTALGDKWQTFRLFLMPFCVSSFSSLIKGQGFVLILPKAGDELLTALGLCVGFVVFVFGVKLFY